MRNEYLIDEQTLSVHSVVRTHLNVQKRINAYAIGLPSRVTLKLETMKKKLTFNNNPSSTQYSTAIYTILGASDMK